MPRASAKKRLEQIVAELSGERYKGVMFPLSPLKNFRRADDRNLSDYNYSVNALAFFVLAIADRLLDEIRLDGEKITLSVDSACRDPAEQEEKYNEWMARCAQDPSLNPTQFYNPGISRGPHSVGGGIDAVMLGRTHSKDLLKAGASPDGAWLPQEAGDRIKASYFKRFKQGWGPGLSASMHQTSHAVLTAKGRRDPKAVKAVANNRFLNALFSALPLSTPINDEYWHLQLRDYADKTNTGGLPSFPLLFEADYGKQDFKAVARMSDHILNLADEVKDRPVYYRARIVPGHRIRFGEESRADEPSMGSKKSLFARLDTIVRRRDKALAVLSKKKLAAAVSKQTPRSER
ncbi:MAG: hypothetical protein LBH41_00405 [Rickettsiales bacterium]|jgi:hypothetical protein|nr:hypothetical protein [Rickettsiales bacterium]